MRDVGNAAGGVAMEAFVETLVPLDVYPLWMEKGLLVRNPTTRALPHAWRYAPLRERLLEAGRLISAENAERRVLVLKNPGLEGKPAATSRLYAGLQLVLPHEIAPAHFHAASAIRFVIEGKGAYTTVDGERAIMAPGDLVLTAAWTVHDHGNETDEAMIWLDGLDLPLVNGLECSFFSEVDTQVQALKQADDASAHMYSRGQLRPTSVKWTKNYSPALKYPWPQTERILLDAWHDGVNHTETDGVMFEFTNPFTGGPTLPTIGCYVQLLAPGEHTAAHRHTTSAVYHVVRGGGTSIVDGKVLTWEERDTFAVPGWAVHEHVNESATDPAILFSFSDEPTLRALGFHREAAAGKQG
jgi:gentisate 1,2-dioxygenase